METTPHSPHFYHQSVKRETGKVEKKKKEKGKKWAAVWEITTESSSFRPVGDPNWVIFTFLHR